MAVLRGKCEGMEGRMRRGKFRIVGVAEMNGSRSTVFVSKLLIETLQMKRNVFVDSSHRILASKNWMENRIITAKLHYY